MSMEGAQAARRDLARGGSTFKARELLRREIDLIKSWLRLTGFTFKDDPAGHDALRQHVRKHLARAFGGDRELTGGPR